MNFGCANITAAEIKVDVILNDADSSNDVYLVKGAPIQNGGALQVIDGGAKYVVKNGDVLKVVSNTSSSLDVIVSTVDDIST